MDSFGIEIRPRLWHGRQAWRMPAVSAVLHLLLLAVLVQRWPVHVVPVRLPGTREGSHVVLTYAPGKAPAQQNATVREPRANRLTPVVIKQQKFVPDKVTAALQTPTPAAKPTDATPGNDALGAGDINIALLAVFPTPRPDLSQLPHGTKGDVVLDVVIDETGKIAQLTMERGVGHGVDESVIATVRQWEFHPATRNGKPVASEQELLFHFERS